MHPESSSRLEKLAVLHVGAMAVFATWAFGGNIGWARSALAITGCAGIAVLLAAVRARLRHQGSLRALHVLWPLLGLNALVVASLFQPNLRPLMIEGGQVFVPAENVIGPASARPDLAWRDLLLFNGLFIPCFNLLLTVRHRRSLTNLLLLLAGNAVALAVFGTFQSLVRANGIYFGSVINPNLRFFSTFIYRNHWGAFAVLMLAVSLALLFSRRATAPHRDFLHSPAPAIAAAILLLAASIPLSGSRACTILALVLAVIGALHALRRAVTHVRDTGRSPVPAAVALCAAIALSLGGIFFVARTSIDARLDDTRQQIDRLRSGEKFGRAILYADTWSLASAHPVFGWGLGSYGTVFSLYNTQTSPRDGLPVHFENAHSDWLQWLAEIGFAGTACIALLMVLPFAVLRGSRPASAFAAYLLAGCALVLAYSLIEFPLANPAVLLCFWACLFVAVRWSQLETADRPA